MFSEYLIKDFQCIWPNYLNLSFLENEHNSTYESIFKNDKNTFMIDKNEYTSQQIAGGFILIFIIAVGFENLKEFVKIKSIEVQKNFLNLKFKLKSVLFNVIILLLIPVVIIICLLFSCYRQIVKIILKIKYGHQFMDLLQDTDPIWAVENIGSYNIINILLFVEVDFKDVSKIIPSFQKLFLEKRLTNSNSYWKLFHSRKIEFGYIFWYKPNDFNMHDHVRELKKIDTNVYISESNLTRVIQSYFNTKLPNNHESTWEILVGQQPISNDDSFEKNESLMKIPVLFRVHHTIGDGVSLLKMLLDLISDSKDDQLLNCLSESNLNEKLMKRYEELSNNINTGFGRYLTYYECLVESAYQLLFSQDDENILHGPNLSGEKIITWMLDRENDSLMKTIQNIKKKYTNITFTDIVLTGVSMGFYEYFKNKSTNVPKKITMVVPIRVSESMFSISKNNLIKSKDEFQLSNKFSVGMITLPLCNRNNIHNNLQYIHQINTRFKQRADYMFNFVVMKLLSATLPLNLISTALKSTKSTLVMSNLPGPKNLTICNKYRLKNIIFWVPHRDSTGIGFSLISYDGQLQLGLNVDKTLVSSTDEARQLLKCIIEGIKAVDSI